ncbi:AMP-binding protein [Actinocrispum sp. NPDC049592]|uniref:AMP-binding protein n=1 Tax=Actinocrispum sp. NPDC049592 TaxID=3154835 RepID=UPI0034264B6A
MSVEWSEAAWRRHLPGVADVAGFVRGLGNATVSGLLRNRADGPGGISVDGAGAGFAELEGGVRAAAGWFAQRVGRGERVVLCGESSLDFVRCYLGVLRVGSVVVLANPAYTEAELDHLVRDSEAALVVRDMSEPVGPDFDDLVGEADDVAVLAYTSGTTGRPKGVPLTHRQLLTSIGSAMAAWRWSPDDVLTHSLPLFHQHGLSGVHATLLAGSTARLFSKFDVGRLTASMRESTILFAVPTIYERLADHPEAFENLRLCVCGSAPLSAALAERLPKMPVVRYGTTESGLNVSNPVDAPRGDTIGIPLPGVHVRIHDGEIQVRGPQVFTGYWRNDENPFTEDGWFRTGDLGEIREDHLVIKGRSKELIITGGLNVYPREVELALEEHPAVVEAAVAGVPDEKWGEQVTAWVVLREPADLSTHARTRLAPYKCPKQIVEVTSLPRNHMGKIARQQLRTPMQRARELGAFTEVFPPGEGIPLAVKENIHRELPGCHTVGRTRMPELALSLTTPGCVNPWGENLHAGGSSGGSAVAVAVGAAKYALGTDTGGSIRVPAALCGVAGLRPTFGVIPMDGVLPLAPSLDTIGPIARTSQECLELHEMLGGTTKPVHEIRRIGVSLSHCGDEVKRVLGEVIDALPFEAVEVKLPDVRAVTYDVMLAEAAEIWWEQRENFSAEVQDQLAQGRKDVGREPIEQARAEVDALLDEVDVIVLPTVPILAAPIGTPDLAAKYFRFTALASATGHPALSVPAGLAGGLPVGVQVIGGRHEEAVLGMVGTMIESAPAGVALAEARRDLVYQISRPK